MIKIKIHLERIDGDEQPDEAFGSLAKRDKALVAAMVIVALLAACAFIAGVIGSMPIGGAL